MKKKIAILLIGVCAIASLCACSTTSKKKKEPANTEKQETEEKKSEEQETEEKESETQETLEEKVQILKVDDSIDINGEELSIEIKSDYSEYSDGDAVLSYAGTDIILDYCEWMCDSYVVTVNDSEFYVYAQLGFSNDYCQTVVVKCSKSEGLKTLGSVWGRVENTDNLSSTSCTIASYEHLLGTYETVVSYDVTDDGLKSKNTDGYIEFNNKNQVSDGSFLDGSEEGDFITKVYDKNGRHILILKRELTFYSDNGDEKLQSGSIVYPRGYNEQNKQFVVEKDGKIGYFKYDKNDAGTFVDGIDQYEAFEELPYAG